MKILIAMLMVASSSFAATNVKFGLNWKAEPEFGGFYMAREEKFFDKHGLNVEILEGGAGTPTIQMLAAGTIDFGIVSGDELVIARSQGRDLVAVYTSYQTAPYIIMARAEKNYKSLGDLFNSHLTLALIKGLPFASYLEHKYSFKNVKVVPYSGGVTNFLNDPNFAQQGFLSSEPLLAERKGAKAKSFLVADVGFNPYVGVVAVRENFLKGKPEIVEGFVSAVREGWSEYLRDPTPALQTIAKLNPTMDVKTMAEMSKVEKKLIELPKSSKEALGSMSESRWKVLVEQLQELKLIKSKVEAKELFVNM